MGKIVKIFINDWYKPVNQKVFKQGTCLDFDTFVQRFNGFFVLLEAGTFLDENMHKKITSSNQQIFIYKADHKKYVHYLKEHQKEEEQKKEEHNLQKEIEHALGIKSILQKQDKYTEKLRAIYYLSRKLIDAWEYHKDEELPKNVIDMIADELVALSQENQLLLSDFKDFLNHDYELASHLLNVAFFALIISSKLPMSFEEKKDLLIAAMLHDVGNIKLDEFILQKTSLLTEEEHKEIKKHAIKSMEIVKKGGFKSPALLKGIKEHHERLDGSGYPLGIKSKHISEFGKIIAVCDVFDALITIKPYRGAYSTFNALQLIKNEYKGKLELSYVSILIKLLK